MTVRRGSCPIPFTVAMVGVMTVLLSYAVTVGADTMWLVALGGAIIASRGVPGGVPFASADTTHWVNVPVLGELTMAAANSVGSWGLVAMQTLIVLVTLSLLAISARTLGASDLSTSVALFLFVMGSLPVLGIVRAQSLSLPCFALVLLLLRQEYFRPTGRIWLIPPLIVLWGNLHGAVLVGVAVAGSYLVFSRARIQPRTAVGVIVVMSMGLWATPAGLRTHAYYIGVLNNAAARRGEGLWAPINFSSPLDLLLVLTGTVLLGLALWGRVPMWERFAILGLVVMTVHTSRHGVWLLMLLVPYAARHLDRLFRQRRSDHRHGAARRRAVALLVTALTAASLPGLAERSRAVGVDAETARRLATAIGKGQPTLAPSPLAEALASAGVTVWASNPIDAFPGERQDAYLDFLADPASFRTTSAQAPERIVLRRDGTPSQFVRVHFDPTATVAGYVVYSRNGR